MAKCDKLSSPIGSMNHLSPSLTDRSDIIERILEEAESEYGLTEKRIMNQFSLSPMDVDMYTSAMMRNGLLRHDAKTNTFRTTEKGIDFLKTIRKMYELNELHEEKTN
jgi:predicted transcriptional regulator